MTFLKTMALSAGAVLALTTASQAAHLSYYKANLTTLNDSGVTGTALLTYDPTLMTLKVNIKATGLEPDSLHVQHIHGAFDSAGNPVDSVTPDISDDADGDGFVELLEGLPNYGPIIVPLDKNGTGAFPMASGGKINFTETYDLTASATYDAGFDILSLFGGTDPNNIDPDGLTLREIVLHGLTIPAGIGGLGTADEDKSAKYSAVLPVAAGEIYSVSAVPVPAAGWMLIAGMGGLGAMRRRNKA